MDVGNGTDAFFIVVRKRNEFSLLPNKESGHATRFLRTRRYYGDELRRRVVSWPHVTTVADSQDHER